VEGDAKAQISTLSQQLAKVEGASVVEMDRRKRDEATASRDVSVEATVASKSENSIAYVLAVVHRDGQLHTIGSGRSETLRTLETTPKARYMGHYPSDSPQ
jgi:hypothetical protein